jgi:KDO2-lipid IV(A) lauroyltransferase
MEIKRLYQGILYRCLEWSFRIILGVSKILAPPAFQRASRPALRLLISVLVPRQRIRRNLRAAFGETYSGATIRGLAKGVQEHFVRNLLDCFLQLQRPDYIRSIATIRGLEHLQGALARGRGVVALGAHIGNFVLVGARLGIEGYPFHTLFRVPADPKLRAVVDEYLPRYYQRAIPSRPRRVAVRQILGALKRNEIVFILGDNLRKGKVETMLFGQRVPSPRGPVSLALRSGAPVVPLYLIRNYQGAMELIIEPEITLRRNSSLPADITDNTRRIVGYLENLIRRYPDQWNWLTVRMRRRRVESSSGG